MSALGSDVAAPAVRLGRMWRSPAEARLEPTSFGMSGGLWTLPVGQRLEVPPLEQMRLIVNMSPLTSHEFWADGRMRRSSATQAGAVRIAPMQEAAWASVKGAAFRFAQIYIPRDALLAIDRQPMSAGATTVFHDPLFDVGDALVAELVGALLRSSAAEGAALYRDHLALALLAHLDFGYGVSTSTPPRAGRLDARRLRIVLDRLNGTEETPTLAELGAMVGLSAHHFARSFRNATGMPPHAYLRTVRVERAKRMLATSAAPITQIAMDCGYGTPSAFATAFLRSTGTTPSAWRRCRS